MSFTGLPYLLFLAAALLFYWRLGHRWQNLFLLGAGAFFYGCVNPWLLAWLAATAGAAHACALGMGRWPGRKKPLLMAALAVGLGLLGVFKYADFFLGNLGALLGLLGLPSFEFTLRLVLPVGISFYTFQCLGYCIDVYRGQIEPRRDALDFALFACFFPTLQAGPIERAGHLLPQIEAPRAFGWGIMGEGLFLLLWGLFQKLVVADNLAVVANKVFALKDPDFWLLWTGVLAFAFQILADFSGYTDMARGSARLLGFELLRNFDQPYLASSPSQFWRRWHMSLSYWLRDYVFIPLGGSRAGEGRTALNLLATFFLSGLWHGASWNFIIWGLYHGLLVVAERLWRRLAPERLRQAAWLTTPKTLFTFALVCVGWLMFKETDLAWLARCFSLSPWAPPAGDPLVARYLLYTALLYALPLGLHALAERLGRQADEGDKGAGRALALARPAAAGLMLLGLLTLTSPDAAVFIYFKF